MMSVCETVWEGGWHPVAVECECKHNAVDVHVGESGFEAGEDEKNTGGDWACN